MCARDRLLVKEDLGVDMACCCTGELADFVSFLLTAFAVAFLQLCSKLCSKAASIQQLKQLSFNPISEIIVDWSKHALWSVWIFLNIENPRSASAFEQ